MQATKVEIVSIENTSWQTDTFTHYVVLLKPEENIENNFYMKMVLQMDSKYNFTYQRKVSSVCALLLFVDNSRSYELILNSDESSKTFAS